MERIDEQILLKNIESAAKRGEQRVKDLSICHDGLLAS